MPPEVNQDWVAVVIMSAGESIISRDEALAGGFESTGETRDLKLVRVGDSVVDSQETHTYEEFA